MRVPRWAGLAAGVMMAAVLTGCEEPQSDVLIAQPKPSYWPWQTSPPSSEPVPVAPEAAPTVVVTFEPAPTEEPTESPTPSKEPTPTPTAEPSPTETESAPAEPAPPSGASRMAELAAQVVVLTNDHRSGHGCHELRVDDRLTAAAQGHSEDMAERDYFSHESPEGDGPGERTRAEGYPWWSGENIALGQRTAEAVVDSWMNSEGHRANILNCQSVAIGVGVADSSRGLYWTQVFGRQ